MADKVTEGTEIKQSHVGERSDRGMEPNGAEGEEQDNVVHSLKRDCNLYRRKHFCPKCYKPFKSLRQHLEAKCCYGLGSVAVEAAMNVVFEKEKSLLRNMVLRSSTIVTDWKIDRNAAGRLCRKLESLGFLIDDDAGVRSVKARVGSTALPDSPRVECDVGSEDRIASNTVDFDPELSSSEDDSVPERDQLPTCSKYLTSTTHRRLKSSGLRREISPNDPLINDLVACFVDQRGHKAETMATTATYLRRFFYFVGRKMGVKKPRNADLK